MEAEGVTELRHVLHHPIHSGFATVVELAGAGAAGLEDCASRAEHMPGNNIIPNILRFFAILIDALLPYIRPCYPPRLGPEQVRQ
jgi:hypothetical protein